MQKRNSIILVIFVLFVGVFSCKEEVEMETVFPKSYFPVYPGSWWLYSNGEMKTTSSNYVLNAYQNDITSPYETKETYVPYWDGHYVYGYGITQNSTEFPLKTILNENLNKPWVVGRFEGQNIMRSTIQKNVKASIVQYPYNSSPNCITDYFEVTETFDLDTPYMDLVKVDFCTDPDLCDTVFVTDTAGVTDTLFYEWQLFTTYDSTWLDSITTCDSIRTYDSVIVVKEYLDVLDPDTCWISKEYYAKNIGLIKREVGSCSDSSATLTDFELVKYFINK